MARTFANFVFALLLLSMVAIPLASLHLTFEVSDFPLYYHAAELFCTGKGADIYRLNLELGKIGAGLNEPPFLLCAVAPLGFLPFPAAKILFDTTMVILLAISAIVLAKTAKLTNRLTLLLVALMVASGPVWEILRISKPSPILFLGLSCCLFSLQKKQDIKAGAWAALCLLKPQEILPFFVFALGGLRVRFLVSCATLCLLLTVVTFPLYGLEGYSNYLSRIPHLYLYMKQHPEYPGTATMPILLGQLLRLSVVPTVATTLSSCMYGLGLLCLLIFGFINRKSLYWWKEGSVIAVVAMACLFPYICAYDLVVIIPGICFSLQRLDQRTNKLLSACVWISIVMFLQPAYSYIHYSLNFLPIDLHFCALFVLAITSILSLTQVNGGITDTTEATG